MSLDASWKDRLRPSFWTILPAILFLLLSSETCQEGAYQQPCGAPCKYGEHLIYLQTEGIRSEERLERILDSLGLERNPSDFQVEAWYPRKIGWLGEKKKEMSLAEYNERLNGGIELFSSHRDHFFRELLYSEKPLTGERQTLYKLRKALHMELGDKNDAIGYVADLCASYDDGCEMAYPSIIPIHKFGVKVKNEARSRWNRDSALENLPFLKEYDVSFYGETEGGKGKFFTDEEEGSVSFGISPRKLSCREIQSLAFRFSRHPRTMGMEAASSLEMATPVGCEKEEVKRREKPDL